MTRLSTLPSTREQAHHALLLLGVPAPVRLVAEVHAALFDGDLSVPALAALLRDEERAFAESTPPVGPAALDSALTGPSTLGPVLPDHRVGPDGGATAWTTADAGRADGTERIPYLICPGLNLDLIPARGIVTLGAWPVADRLVTSAAARAEALAVVVRIAEIAPMRPGACTATLLRRLAETVPGGPEAFDPLDLAALAELARAELAAPALADALATEEPARAAAAERAGRLDARQRLFGVPGVPHQRGPA